MLIGRRTNLKLPSSDTFSGPFTQKDKNKARMQQQPWLSPQQKELQSALPARPKRRGEKSLLQRVSSVGGTSQARKQLQNKVPPLALLLALQTKPFWIPSL